MILFILAILFYYVNNENIELFFLFIKNPVFVDNFIFMCGIIPLKIYGNLTKPENFRSELHKVGGVYGIVNISNPKKIRQYIGSSKDLYHRIMDQPLLRREKNRSSNSRLQRSIAKSFGGIANFKIYIYYFHLDTSVMLTDIETEVIKSFPFATLYNYKKEANSTLGYKHTITAIKKMKLRYTDKTKHPMYGKTHDSFAISKISKRTTGILNPMFGKTHSIETKLKMSLSRSKFSVGLYDTQNKLIQTFPNQVELSNFLNLSKSTIGRYLKSGKLILNKYFIKIINN